ncbi:MAG: hypothetical protein EON98_16255 [Chitinophagaceae bacterium]|nr:MAG: hypothetical protein EON98_16255 [Chitinophagaceae bacterium]
MKKWLFAFVFFCRLSAYGQDTLLPLRQGTVAQEGSDYDLSQQMKGRKLFIGSLTAAGYGGSFVFLSTAWYPV